MTNTVVVSVTALNRMQLPSSIGTQFAAGRVAPGAAPGEAYPAVPEMAPNSVAADKIAIIPFMIRSPR
ncbi:hypothetical protein [Actinoplanes campanulatus]|uniref:hypothetical protein n=1 Tax=Actinoplanes campanulatus TaxID=113559 RepID=UPI001954542A|nr:hypothetical protein [Actinoplanes capillaceus]